ncbi:MAG: hypothetical protein LN409_03460 [Candidatus Thermoplasmatota archaeon]|nr:hypothetical protein [Candidatus Thermoplasmatota archaeon]
MIRDRAMIGIEGLDEMLEGGLLTGRPYIVSGTTGTGKTTLAMHFLREGAMNGERVLYVAIDEPPNEVRYNYSKFGWDLNGIGVLDGTPDILSYDKTPVRDVSSERSVVSLESVGDAIRRTSEKGPTDVTISTIQELIKQEFKERKYTRVVVDSLTSLKYFYIRTTEEFATLQSFFRMLSDLGATTVLAVDIPDVHRPGLESQLARGEIRLHKWFDGRGLMRGVTIDKYRGSSHDSRMRHLKITSTGIVVPSAGKGRSKKDASAKKGPKAGKKHEAAKPEPSKQPPSEEDLPPPPDDFNQQQTTTDNTRKRTGTISGKSRGGE